MLTQGFHNKAKMREFVSERCNGLDVTSVCEDEMRGMV
jgi:hypothetical protein